MPTDFTVSFTTHPTRHTPRDVPAVFHVQDWRNEYDRHITDHYDHDAFPMRQLPAEDCAFCAAQMFLPALHDMWTNGTDAQRATMWSMQDGYGTPGFIPAQGPDWSGIRDSMPATLYAMHRVFWPEST